MGVNSPSSLDRSSLSLARRDSHRSVVILIGNSQPKADRVTLVFVVRHRVMEAGGQYVRFPNASATAQRQRQVPVRLGRLPVWQAG